MKDLERIQWRHSPDLAWDKTLPEQFEAIAIGWLEDRLESEGKMTPETLSLLEKLCATCTIDQGWLGYHTCDICSLCEDRGEVLLITGNRWYVMPHMILHYVKEHNYIPPGQFLEDLRTFAPIIVGE